MMNRRVINYFFVFSLIANGVLIWHTWPYLFEKKQNTATNGLRAREYVLIKVATAKRESIARKKNFSGTIKAFKVVPIVSELHGRVAKVNFKQGDKIKKNQLLIKLDDTQAQAQLREAEAAVGLNQANYQRQQLLFSKKISSLATLEKAKAELAVAIAQREKAQVSFNHTRIVAPFDGEIGFTNISKGAQVDPNKEITRLVNSKTMIVEFQVPEIDVKHMSVGQEIDLRAEGYDSLPMTAIVQAIEPYSDSIAHTTKVIAKVDNSDNKLRDGAYANITVPLAFDENTLVVPKEAVTAEGGSDHVFVIDENVAHQRDVIVGIGDGSSLQIVDGLKPGDVVAIDPVEMLMDQTPIRVDTSE